MHMKKKLDGNWIIYNFVKEHNHEICPDDFFRGRSKQTSNVACQKNGMQLIGIDLDQNRHLRTAFWVNSKSRLDYQNFGDIVLIDTFYLKNKYKIPFVPFVGVNHHFQYILLGRALVGEETASAFIWWKLINRFELKNNDWVQSLYEDRKKWVPAYMKDVSFAGLSTAVRSESVSSSFDKYIHADSTFKEFIEQYKVFSTDSFDMETIADFETRQKKPALRSSSPFENQLSTIYTDAIFRKFRLEILGMMSCHLRKETEDRVNVTFVADDFEEQKKLIVS